MKTFSQIIGPDTKSGAEHKHWHYHKNHVGHRTLGKYAFGPGGINCSCCRKDSPTNIKIKTARMDRRKVKQELQKQLQELPL